MTPVPEVPVVSEERLRELRAEFTDNCNKLKYGECRTRACLLRRADDPNKLAEPIQFHGCSTYHAHEAIGDLLSRRAADAQTSRCVECGQLAITNQHSQTGREGR